MKWLWRLLLLLYVGLAPCLRAGTTIVVHAGPFPSVEAAATGEAKVNWHDADRADDRACTECFAALELQRYLRKMTGRADDFAFAQAEKGVKGDLIRVRTAAEPRASLGPEGYAIRSAAAGGRRVTTIEGGGRVGTLYGAYDLLHRLGCRWFAPGEAHEDVPRIDRIPDLDVTEKPSFLTRGFHAWEDRGSPDFLLWMARNRCNYWCVQQSNHPLLRKLGIMLVCGGHSIQPWYLDPKAPYPYDHPTFKGDDKKPKDPYPLSTQYHGDANKDGTLSYFEAHPEWYAMVKGKRVPGIRGAFGTNYCTSNPHATDELMKNAVQDLIDGKFRDADIVRFWTLDAGKWCQCPACKALGIPTDRSLLLVHRFAQEVKKAQAAGKINRKIVVRFLAYHDVLHPPTRPLPPDFDYTMCSATYFPIVRCYVHNFDDPTCSYNRRYCQHLHGWVTAPKRHYRGELCIGEYYNVSGYKCLPICFMHTMANDIPYFYHKAGARHFHYMHCTTANWGNKALTNWQMARQLWDVGTDCEALWTDYFARRYGPAAATMRRFYESLEKMLCNVSRLKYGLARRLNGGAKKLFPSSHLRYRREPEVKADGPTLVEIVGHAAACRKLIDQALAVELPERVKARIAEDERLFTYGERTVLYFDACAQAFALARAGKRDEARRHYAEARRLADLLRADTTSTKLSSSHASAANAFVASYATGALAQLAEMLGPEKPGAIKAFDPAKGLVLIGRDFAGGKALRYGYGLSVYPARKKVSDHGNGVYGRPTGAFSRMTAWFRLDEPPKGPLSLTLIGLCYPIVGQDEVPVEILLNGKRVFHGPAPFTGAGLTPHQFVVPAEALKKGENKLTIRNLSKAGRVGSRPWFGIDRAELRIAPSAR